MGALYTVAFVFAIFGAMMYFYTNPVLLPDVFSIQNVLPENIQESVQKTTHTISKGVKTEIAKATDQFRPEFDAAAIEAGIFELTNVQRMDNGLEPLKIDTALASVARAHSADMAKRDYFAHITPEGLDPTDRAKKADYSCVKFYGVYYTDGVGENLAKNWLYSSYKIRGNYMSYNWNTDESLADEIVTGWMNSEGHRKNILTPEFDRIGIGVVIAPNDAVYATQNFC